ncbi:MAG: PilZ domain-containing protein [Spirochaetales bacterium]|jgi:hypothetical protein|nr:PilZ domain-containing protein [Spirochaetales bacterium]
MPDGMGRKIFILFPQKVIREEMIHLLIASEYEVALIADRHLAMRAIAKYPNSIVFVNIDEGLRETEWEALIRNLMSDDKTKQVSIGIISSGNDLALKEKYLMTIGVPCGYVSLRPGLKESFKIIVKTLEANEARGRRKYIRAECRLQDKASFNIKLSGEYLAGDIVDISSVGMACTFDKPIQLRPGSSVSDIQLKLRAILCRLSGKLVGTTLVDGIERHVILFDKSISPKERHKIHKFVYERLQESIDEM